MQEVRLIDVLFKDRRTLKFSGPQKNPLQRSIVGADDFFKNLPRKNNKSCVLQFLWVKTGQSGSKYPVVAIEGSID